MGWVREAMRGEGEAKQYKMLFNFPESKNAFQLEGVFTFPEYLNSSKPNNEASELSANPPPSCRPLPRRPRI